MESHSLYICVESASNHLRENTISTIITTCKAMW